MGVLQYDNLEAKRSKFKYSEQARITSESDFNDFFYTHNGRVREFVKSSIFRGVGEAKWKIFSSCQRAFLSGKVYGDNQSLFIEREVSCLENSVLPDYYKKLGIQETVFLYLSFLQHYGAPTTLIDFTSNYKTALWMAVNSIQYQFVAGNCDDISHYFSIYWIEKKDRKTITSILNAYKEDCLSRLLGESDDKNCPSKNGQNGEIRNELLMDKNAMLKNVIESLKWNNDGNNASLAKTKLGIIYSNNNIGRFDKRYSIRQITKEMRDAAESLSKKTTSASAIKAFKNIVSYLFNDAIKIANLNLVAQDSCFIHYMPDDYKTPLEEYRGLTDKIHCVDIHKSLAPFILKELEKENITQGALFPDSYILAQDAFRNAQAVK